MEFKTQKALKEHVNKLLSTYQPEISLKTLDSSNYDFWEKFIRRHPKFTNKNISDIKITLNFQRSKELNVLVDGEWLSCSKLKCITKKETTDLQKLNEACREAIGGSVLNFKNSKNCDKCELCGSTNLIEIDHIYEFKNILQDFKNKLGKDFETLKFKKGGKRIPTYEFEDEKYRLMFKELHDSHTNNLRPLCRLCNVKRNIKN
jgi:hypothetical protein